MWWSVLGVTRRAHQHRGRAGGRDLHSSRRWFGRNRRVHLVLSPMRGSVDPPEGGGEATEPVDRGFAPAHARGASPRRGRCPGKRHSTLSARSRRGQGTPRSTGQSGRSPPPGCSAGQEISERPSSASCLHLGGRQRRPPPTSANARCTRPRGPLPGSSSPCLLAHVSTIAPTERPGGRARSRSPSRTKERGAPVGHLTEQPGGAADPPVLHCSRAAAMRRDAS